MFFNAFAITAADIDLPEAYMTAFPPFFKLPCGGGCCGSRAVYASRSQLAPMQRGNSRPLKSICILRNRIYGRTGH